MPGSGWDQAQRRSRLHRIVNHTGFLILPWVRCVNLGSRVLALAARCVAADFRTRYALGEALGRGSARSRSTPRRRAPGVGVAHDPARRHLRGSGRTLQVYLCRWEIERLHRVLKSGCKVEEIRQRFDFRLQPVIVLYMLVAWRLLYRDDRTFCCPRMLGSFASHLSRAHLSDGRHATCV